jgi:erythromycin esterase
MRPPSIVALLLMCLAGSLAIAQQRTPTAHAPSDVLNTWIAEHAVAVRSIDPMDEDFSDLEPLVDAIGSSRVVQLGEPSHGAGSAFAAKVRLIKFLHQRMGFDVLAWESGLYDVEASEAGLRAGDDAAASARRGIFPIWSTSEEIRPLFEYAKESRASSRPLVMAGFDANRTGRPYEEFPAELRSFVDAVRDPALRDEAVRAATDVIDAFDEISAYAKAGLAHWAELSRAGTTGDALAEALAAWERETGAALRPGPDAIERLRPAIDRLTELFDRNAGAFAEIAGDRRRGFMARAVVNLGFQGVELYEEFGVPVPPPIAQVVVENRRDALMAENLRWLIEEGYPDRKIIVWAHNAHVMNAYYEAPNFNTISLEAVPNSMKTMGVHLAEWLGDDLYTIGITAYEGQDELIGNPATAMVIPPAPEGSVEERLHRLGYAHAFLDLRAARGEADHPLGGPQTMRVPKYDSVEIADATQPYDAIFYIARMEAATLIR